LDDIRRAGGDAAVLAGSLVLFLDHRNAALRGRVHAALHETDTVCGEAPLITILRVEAGWRHAARARGEA
jgi:hypothetical protein